MCIEILLYLIFLFFPYFSAYFQDKCVSCLGQLRKDICDELNRLGWPIIDPWGRACYACYYTAEYLCPKEDYTVWRENRLLQSIPDLQFLVATAVL